MPKHKRKPGEGSFIYARAAINALGAVHTVAKVLGLPAAAEILLLVETQSQSKRMHYFKDYAKPFCDRAVANALVALKPQLAEDVSLRVDVYLDEFAARLAAELAASAQPATTESSTT